jgi:hypothetical protein
LAKIGSDNFRPPWRQQTDRGDKSKQYGSQPFRDIEGAVIGTQLQLAGKIKKKKIAGGDEPARAGGC